jgi:probable F420-dependent oxidoreductase
MDLGRVGIWTVALDGQRASVAKETASELESLGYGAIWLPETVGRDPIVHAGLLLSGTSSIVVATGITSIYARDAMTAAAAQKTLEEAYPGRFMLGLGVSHQPMVEAIRGHEYGRPLPAMRAYLDRMDSAMYFAAQPSTPPRRVLAAIGPKMLELARVKADGAHPYNVPLEHTTVAREILGPGKLLCPEIAAVLTTDPDTGRAVARRHLRIYLDLPNYRNGWLRFGFTEDDMLDGGSDRLVDALVARGSVDDIAAAVRAHLEAGADHVCVQLLPVDSTNPMADPPPIDGWRELAPALTSL